QPGERRDVLGNHGKSEPPGEIDEIVAGGREDGTRGRGVVGQAGFEQSSLARQSPRQGGLGAWAGEEGGGGGGVFGQQDRGLVVGGYRYREPSQRATDGAKLFDQLLGVVALAPRPYEMTGEVARQRDRGQTILGDRVHRHTEPAEGANDAQAAGVNRVM